jgi:hypothetical protein
MTEKNEKSNTGKIPQNYDEKISKLLDEMVDLTFVSEKGHGKTVACMDLASKIAENPNNRVIVFESFPKWCIEFPAKFLEIPKSWIVETDKTIDLQDTWIKHEQAFTVLNGNIINEFLHENKNCTFLINNDDIEAIAFFIYSVIYKFYRLRYDLLRKGYPIKEKVYFVLEEAQNSLSNQVLSSKLFRKYRKLFSEMRNMGLYAVLITQRLQDISTYFRCRTSLAIGKIALDDWDLKVKRLLSPIQDKDRILAMPKGSFYFTAINDIIAFPIYNPSKPTEFKQPTQQVKKYPSIIKAFFIALTGQTQNYKAKHPELYANQQQEQQENEEQDDPTNDEGDNSDQLFDDAGFTEF